MPNYHPLMYYAARLLMQDRGLIPAEEVPVERPKVSKLRITAKDALTSEIEILLDGKPVNGCTRIEFEADSNDSGLLHVRLTLLSDVEVDANVVLVREYQLNLLEVDVTPET